MTISYSRKGPIGTMRGRKITAVITSRRGKAIKFTGIPGVFTLPGALALVTLSCLEKAILTLNLKHQKVIGVRL